MGKATFWSEIRYAIRFWFAELAVKFIGAGYLYSVAWEEFDKFTEPEIE